VAPRIEGAVLCPERTHARDYKTSRPSRTRPKRIERAEKLLQKGKAAEALEEYLLALRDDPKTIQCGNWRRICVCRRTGRDAVKLLGELFERQVNAGDATRASLTYKKLARHGSPTWEQKFRFGQLLEGSNKKLAVGTYESALSDLAKLENKGRPAGAGAAGGAGAGAGEFSAGGGNFVGSGGKQGCGASVQAGGAVAAAAGGDPAQWYERAYQEDSSDEEITLAYGKSLLGRGRWEQRFLFLSAGECGEEFSAAARDLCRGSAGGRALCGSGAAGVATLRTESQPDAAGDGADWTVGSMRNRMRLRCRWRASWDNSMRSAASGGSFWR
jgi:tetratricopeptide (TPR) repeat protein